MMVEEARGRGAESPRIGRDELNLTEFPFALLASRASKNAPLTLEFRDGEKEWVVSGDPRYGLPTAGDVEIYVALMELTREQKFPVCVHFSRHNVIQRLGWDPGGQSYDRLLLSLDRLVGVTIRTQNAFWDARQRSWVRRHAFHILEAYEINDSRQARPDEPPLFPSWFRWSPELYQNLQSGHIKSLDVGLFLSLKSSISQALYRYLDTKRYDGKPLYRMGLKKLAWEHLGLSRGYFPSDIKRKLAGAHEELIGVGLLSGVEYAPMKNGEEMVVYRFAPRATRAAHAQAETAPEARKPLSELAQRLIAAGVSRATAVELADTLPDDCERQLDYLLHRKPRDPGAVLVKSIREGWAPPPEVTERTRGMKLVRTTSARPASRAAKATTGQLFADAPATETDPETAFEAWWKAQPEAHRREWLAGGMARLRRENKMLADFAAKCPDSPMLKAALRPILMELSGWRDHHRTE